MLVVTVKHDSANVLVLIYQLLYDTEVFQVTPLQLLTEAAVHIECVHPCPRLSAIEYAQEQAGEYLERAYNLAYLDLNEKQDAFASTYVLANKKLIGGGV